MTDILIGTPGSVQRDLATKTNRVSGSAPVPASQLSDYAARVDVAELAYELWQERGRPNGSAETDWLEAEQRVRERAHH